MKLKVVLGALAVLLMASVCVRLGLWQVSRLHEKQALNRAQRVALSAPAIELGHPLPSPDGVAGRRVQVRGRYDERRHILLSARSHNGSPGVDVVTPLLVEGDSVAVLVDRGWMFAGDAQTADPERYPEPGLVTVLGIADTMRHGAGGMSVQRFATDSTEHFSARWLDRDSLASRFPYALAPFAVRQLPGPGVPVNPTRREPTPFNEMMHVSYAVQWFLFASILVGGSSALAWSRRRRRGEEEITTNAE